MTYTVLPNESSETIRTAFKQVREAVEANGGAFTRNCEVMFDFDKNLRQVYMEEIGNDYGHKLRGWHMDLMYVGNGHSYEKHKLVLQSTSWCF